MAAPVKVRVGVTAADRATADRVGVAVLREMGKRGAVKTQKPEAPLCEAAVAGIHEERMRVVSMLDAMTKEALAAMRQAGAQASSAVDAGDVNAAVRLKTAETMHRARAEVMVFLMTEVVRDPSACPECGGSARVPSAIVSGETVACPRCSDPSTDAEGRA